MSKNYQCLLSPMICTTTLKVDKANETANEETVSDRLRLTPSSWLIFWRSWIELINYIFILFYLD